MPRPSNYDSMRRDHPRRGTVEQENHRPLTSTEHLVLGPVFRANAHQDRMNSLGIYRAVSADGPRRTATGCSIGNQNDGVLRKPGEAHCRADELGTIAGERAAHLAEHRLAV